MEEKKPGEEEKKPGQGTGKLSRRDFIKSAGLLFGGVAAGAAAGGGQFMV